MRNQKNIMLLLTCIFVLAGTQQAQAQNWLFDMFFPGGKSDSAPTDSLRAPFANEDAVIVDMDDAGNESNNTPLHLRHRINEDITLWVQQNLPNFLSYQAQDYTAQYNEKLKYFSEVGTQEYTQFLHDKNFITTLKTGGYDITGFVKGYPVLLNEGAIAGRYRWLYEANIMVTLLKTGVSDYRYIDDGDSITLDYVVTFQLGRDKNVDNEHGVLIETWSVKEADG